MAFARGPLIRTPATTRARDAVFAVGGRAEVSGAGDRSPSATLTDETGKVAIGNLGDGTSVVVLAWRPGWAGNTRYLVRTTSSGAEGWLAVGNLRRLPVVVATPKPAAVVPSVRVGRPRAAARRETGAPAGKPAPARARS